ncbi:hypothetical protein [Auraticoccus monumenti]|uniref:DUF2567 domain-containing protein n=1 Tax=Auraticoccus monumenti TaxID=675864 RepID=A0A1G7B853_9ACTN|nr:hypothetical protein [Auraticoccus monumenti]SDE22435.1 hypothetical protein SAMN04489747_2852 [Auraticoccus monumenti]
MSDRLSEQPAPGPDERGPRQPGEGGASRRPSLLTEMTVFFTVCLVVGVLAGLLWARVTDLPGYTIAVDGRATTSERGLAEQFSADAWFCVIAVGGGLLIGLLAWWRLIRVGWGVVLAAVLGALLAAVLTWVVGWAMGPGDFDARLANAEPGDVVPIELTLRAPVALVVWPFIASIPILLWSSLAPDDEEPTPLFTRGRLARRRHESVAGVLPEDRVGLPAAPPPDGPGESTSSGPPPR